VVVVGARVGEGGAPRRSRLADGRSWGGRRGRERERVMGGGRWRKNKKKGVRE
jgi:hypothetical protein